MCTGDRARSRTFSLLRGSMSMISRWPVCCSFVRSFASRSACSATFGMSLTTTSFLQIYTILRGTMLYVFVNRGMHACGIVCVVCVCEYHCSLMIKWYRCDPFFLSLLSSNSIYSFCSSQPWFNRFSHSNANNILHLHHVTLHNIKITKKKTKATHDQLNLLITYSPSKHRMTEQI